MHLIFDLDGVLIETEKYHHCALKKVVPWLDLNNTLGMTTVQILKKNNISEVCYNEILRHKREIFNDFDLSLPEVSKELLAALSTSHVLHLASNNNRVSVMKILGDEARYFESIVTKDEVASPKPSPDVYLKIKKTFSLNKENCLAFEDSDTGIESAQAADLNVIRVTFQDVGRIPCLISSFRWPEKANVSETQGMHNLNH